jgi:adenosylcobinamide kinase / adenosylcobinamide-phosphate guanylyltransferase
MPRPGPGHLARARPTPYTAHAMERGLIVLVGGGVRSGKSAFAERRALSLAGAHKPLYVATAEVYDSEMGERVARHRAQRGERFRSEEHPLKVAERIAAEPAGSVLVDCLTLWLSNLLCRDLDEAAVLGAFDELEQVLATRARHVVMVSNEVGLGIVPDNALARRFRDLAGILHQRLGRSADEVYFGALGQLLRLKPAPVALAEAP